MEHLRHFSAGGIRMCLAVLDDHPVTLQAVDYLPDPLLRQGKELG